jgi:hypothetical protein
MFRGRADGKLSRYATLHDWQQFTRCLYEELEHSRRLHGDASGNLPVCKGISIGNAWERAGAADGAVASRQARGVIVSTGQPVNSEVM